MFKYSCNLCGNKYPCKLKLAKPMPDRTICPSKITPYARFTVTKKAY